MSKEMIICRCEEVTRQEIIAAIRSGARSISAVKRRTSGGMGLCQGRICQRLIAQILSQEAGVPMSEATEPMTVRPPVRPLPISDIAGR